MHKCLTVVSKTKDCRWLLDHSLIPFNFQHLIFIGRNTVALIFLDDRWWVWLLFWDRISITINLLFFIIFSILFTFLFIIFLWRWQFFFLDWIAVSVLNVALLFLINIWKSKNSIRVLHRGPDIDISVNAPWSKILISKVRSQAQGNNLDNLIIVSLHHDVVLIALLEAHDEVVAIAHWTDEKVVLLSGDTHVMQRLVRFVGVTAALQFIIPHFHRLVVSTRHELSFTNLD